jgi:hypothetical protein
MSVDTIAGMNGDDALLGTNENTKTKKKKLRGF